MTAAELYSILNENGVDFDVIEVFEGSRFIRVEIEEDDEQEQEQ
jgi:hypothetical protein